MQTSRIDKVKAKLAKVEEKLEGIRGKEYALPFGSMRRARVSRNWDHYAKIRMALLMTLESLTARDVLAPMSEAC